MSLLARREVLGSGWSIVVRCEKQSKLESSAKIETECESFLLPRLSFVLHRMDDSGYWLERLRSSVLSS